MTTNTDALPPLERADFDRWCEANGHGTVDDVLAPLDRSLRAMMWSAWQARAALAAQQGAQVPQWQPIKTAPRDGSNLLLRFGSDGVSQGKFVPGLPHPWKFIDTNDGVTWLVNHAIDGPGGPSHWMRMPSTALSASPQAPAQRDEDITGESA